MNLSLNLDRTITPNSILLEPLHSDDAIRGTSPATTERTSRDKADQYQSSPTERTDFHLKRSRPLELGNSFLHSVGLKLLTPKALFKTPLGTEKEKILVSGSRAVAAIRAGVHLLPIIASATLIAVNSVTIVRSSDLSYSEKFALQAISKLHVRLQALVIVLSNLEYRSWQLLVSYDFLLTYKHGINIHPGSLTTVLADMVRYQLLNEGIEFGLLTSAFWYSAANFIWSQSFWSLFRRPICFRRVVFMIFISAFGLLATIVGPASALLVLPTQSWLPGGGSEFYLKGTESDLWPQHLTSSLSPPECLNYIFSPYRCLYGGLEDLSKNWGFSGISEENAWSIPILDQNIRRQLHIFRPRGSVTQSRPATWATTTHIATLLLADNLIEKHKEAVLFARGKESRLQNAGVTMTTIDGKTPVLRTVCSQFKEIKNDTKFISFPVLKNVNLRWNNLTELKDLPVDADWVIPQRPKEVFLRADRSRIRANWLTLPLEFGETTAGLIYVVRNDSMAVARGCAIDAHWARAEVALHQGSNLNSWEPRYAEQVPPQGATLNAQEYDFPLLMTRGVDLGKAITADSGFFDTISLQVNTTWNRVTGPMSMFEGFLLMSDAGNLTWNIDIENEYLATVSLE